MSVVNDIELRKNINDHIHCTPAPHFASICHIVTQFKYSVIIDSNMLWVLTMQYGWGHKHEEVVLDTWATVSGKVMQRDLTILRWKDSELSKPCDLPAIFFRWLCTDHHWRSTTMRRTICRRLSRKAQKQARYCYYLGKCYFWPIPQKGILWVGCISLSGKAYELMQQMYT